MADLRIEEYNVGDIGTNCYFIVNADTKEMVIIDPGGDGADLIRRIKERGLKLQAVLLTHGHYDHAHHARMVADAFGSSGVCKRERRSYHARHSEKCICNVWQPGDI